MSMIALIMACALMDTPQVEIACDVPALERAAEAALPVLPTSIFVAEAFTLRANAPVDSAPVCIPSLPFMGWTSGFT